MTKRLLIILKVHSQVVDNVQDFLKMAVLHLRMPKNEKLLTT